MEIGKEGAANRNGKWSFNLEIGIENGKRR